MLGRFSIHAIYKHESKQEDDLDRAALWQHHKKEEEVCASEDVDYPDCQEIEAQGERFLRKEQEVDKV